MRNDGPIIALDLGVRMGVAIGDPRSSEPPRSFTVILKNKFELQERAAGNLIAWLDEAFRGQSDDTFRREPVRLVVKEAPLHLEGLRKLKNAADTVVLTLGLHMIVGGLCDRYGIPLKSFADSTIRKHFIGRGRMGTRAATKAAVLQRCHLLKLLPQDCNDEDRADAIALFSYAQATYFGRTPQSLYLFGEVA